MNADQSEPDDTLAITAEVDALCDRYEEALRRGEAGPLGAWLPAEEPARRAALMELVRVELEHRREAGEAVEAADYFARFPELVGDPSIAARLLAAERDGRQGRSGTAAAQPPDPLDGGTVPEAGPSAAALRTSAATVQVPGYEILEELGRGGMGAVFKGRDPELGRELAVKVLLERCQDDPRLLQRFIEEAQIGGQLQHPGVVPVYEAGRLPDRRPYFTMKLVEGRTLADLLKERPTPAHELPRFLKVFEQICQTLAYAHSRGVIHRDLKPSNVMVGAFGEVQVMDWGLAKVLGHGVRTVRSARAAALSEAGSVMGTPAYMAPEQACGDVEGLDERCDVFGLGAMLCEVLTGSPPYRGETAGELLRQAARANLADAFGRLDGCGADVELARLAKGCLAAEPSARPADAGAVAAAVTAHLAGVQERLRQAELAKAAAQARAAEERKRRRMTVVLAVTVLAAVTGAGAGALWIQQDRAARASEHARKAANTERDVTAALQEATAFGKQATGLHDDPAKWEAALQVALSAVKRADGVLNNGEGGEVLRVRVDALRAELEAADKDRRTIAGLEAARFQEAAAGHENGFDHVGAVVLYRTAFQQDDPGWDALEPNEAAARINGRAIREDLLAALDEWAMASPNPEEAKRLRGIVQAADPDPGSLRNRCQALLDRKDWDGLRRLAFGPEAKDVPTARLVRMGRQLGELGAASEAVKFLEQADDCRPGDFWIAFELAFVSHLTEPPATDEAIRYYTAALMLRPNSAMAHNNLGNALYDKHQVDKAIREYNRAIKLQPDLAMAHYNRGHALKDKGQLDDAIEDFRNALKFQPAYVKVHYTLGNALLAKGQPDQAIAEYRTAIQFQPDLAEAWCNLGAALQTQGRFTESLAADRRGHQLGSQKPDWHYPSAEWVRQAEDLAERDALLPAILRGEAAPADADQQIRFADFCRTYKRLDAAASRFYADAFAAEPRLAEDLSSVARYNAACAAALAGCGQGDDAATTDAQERGRWRKQALDWLRGDLELWIKKTDDGKAEDRAWTVRALLYWKGDANLAGVRDADALTKLPAEEQDDWRKLWADVDALLLRAKAPPKEP